MPRLELSWSEPGAVLAFVPTASLWPRYNDATRATADDAAGDGGPRVADAASRTPADRLPATMVADFAGLDLDTQVTYEGAGGFSRPVTKTLPADTTTTYEHYGVAETRANPCASLPAANQGGALRRAVSPDPDGTGPKTARTQEYVYDGAGRQVAMRVNADAWRCSAYDARGRVTSASNPANGAEAARTVTVNHAVDSDPRKVSVTDAEGTIITVVDLLGRTTTYTDASTKVTSYEYDQAGRLVRTRGPVGRLDTDYDDGGRVTAQKLADDPDALLPGATLATPTSERVR